MMKEKNTTPSLSSRPKIKTQNMKIKTGIVALAG
jgi:hypothetical protein